MRSIRLYLVSTAIWETVFAAGIAVSYLVQHETPFGPEARDVFIVAFFLNIITVSTCWGFCGILNKWRPR